MTKTAQNLELELVRVTPLPCDSRTFRFALTRDIPYKPGQYLILTLLVGGKEMSKPFSLCSSPTEHGYVEFTKKLSGSDFSQALKEMVVGRRYRLRFPFGRFTFEGEFPKVAFLAGGIGIAPIRGMIRYVTDLGLPVDMVLLYSSRNPDCLVFKDELAQMRNLHPALKVVHILTRCDEAVEGCVLGAINEDMIREEIPDFPSRVHYVCGPSAMVREMADLLVNRLGLAADRVKTEGFFGYEEPSSAPHATL